MVFVADVGLGNEGIKVFSLLAGGNAAPLFTITDFDGSPEGIAYSAYSDSLYIANGPNVQVYDEVLTTRGAGRPTRELTFGAENPVGIHVANSRIYVVDRGVGEEPDGAIYILDNAALSSGAVVPELVIQGAEAGLVDPGQVTYNDGIWVVDAISDRVSVWSSADIFGLQGTQDLPPSHSFIYMAAAGICTLVD